MEPASEPREELTNTGIAHILAISDLQDLGAIIVMDI